MPPTPSGSGHRARPAHHSRPRRARPAKPGGNAPAAAACQNGGYLDYTDAAGNAFRNEGDCVRYAARGGTLVPIATAPFSVVYSSIVAGWVRATLTGTGLEPSSSVTFSFVWPDRSVAITFDADTSGSVSLVHDENCLDATGAGLSSLTATGTPAGGALTSYSLATPPASICP